MTPTVCLVHPGGMPAAIYRPLTIALSPAMAVEVAVASWLPEPSNGRRGKAPEVSVELMADRIAAGLRPDRRYLLAGWSFGGLVALAAAERLARRTPPAGVVLLETVAPWHRSQPPERPVGQGQMLSWFCMFLGARAGRALPVGTRHLDGTIGQALAYIRREGVSRHALAPDTTAATVALLFEVFADGVRRSSRIADAYRPRRPPAGLTVVKAEHSMLPAEPALGWDALAGTGLNVVSCPGDHYSLVSDPAGIPRLAEIFQAAARPGVPPPPL